MEVGNAFFVFEGLTNEGTFAWAFFPHKNKVTSGLWGVVYRLKFTKHILTVYRLLGQLRGGHSPFRQDFGYSLVLQILSYFLFCWWWRRGSRKVPVVYLRSIPESSKRTTRQHRKGNKPLVNFRKELHSSRHTFYACCYASNGVRQPLSNNFRWSPLGRAFRGFRAKSAARASRERTHRVSSSQKKPFEEKEEHMLPPKEWTRCMEALQWKFTEGTLLRHIQERLVPASARAGTVFQEIPKKKPEFTPHGKLAAQCWFLFVGEMFSTLPPVIFLPCCATPQENGGRPWGGRGCLVVLYRPAW